MRDERPRQRNFGGNGGRQRLADEDTAAVDSTTTIVRRLLRNIGVMALGYRQAAAQDVRLAVRDFIFGMVLFSAVMMLGVYLFGLMLTAAVLALSRSVPGWAAALVVFTVAALVMGL